MRSDKSGYSVVEVTDTRIVLVDRDQGRSVTNDAENVILRLHAEIIGGIGHRKIYYRDTDGRFDELTTLNGRFTGFKACTDSQQHSLNQALLTMVCEAGAGSES